MNLFLILFFVFSGFSFVPALEASVVIFNLKSQSIPAGQLNKFSSALRKELGEIAVVLKEEEMKAILKSKGKQLKECDKKDSAIEFGELLDATDIVWGNAEKTGSQSYTFDIAIINIKGMDYNEKKIQVKTNSDDLIKLVNDLANKISKEFPAYLFVGKIIKIEKEDIYVSLGKIRVEEGTKLSVFHTQDTLISKEKIFEYKETGILIIKKVLGDTFAIASSVGKCQAGDFVKMESYGLGKTNFTVSFSSLEVKPRVLTSVQPSFPVAIPSINGTYIDGTVFLSIVIDTAGNVTEAKVIKSLHPAYDSCAIEAAKKWKFSPAKQKDKPVRVRMEIPIRFSAPSK